MTGSRMRPAIIVAGLLLSLLAVTLQGVQGEELEKVPSEDQCRPYIEKALKDLGTEGSQEQTSAEDAEGANDDNDDGPGEDTAADANETDEKSGSREKRDVSAEGGDNEGDDKSDENENEVEQEQVETVEVTSAEDDDDQENGSVQVVGDEEGETNANSKEDDDKSKEADAADSKEAEEAEEPSEGGESAEGDSAVAEDESGEQKEGDEASAQDETEETQEVADEADEASEGDNVEESAEQTAEEEEGDAKSGEENKSTEEETAADSKEEAEASAESVEQESTAGGDDDDQKEGDSKEEDADKSGEQEEDDKKSVEEEEVVAEEAASVEQEPETTEASEQSKDTEDEGKSEEAASGEAEKSGEAGEEEETEGESDESRPEEEELIMEIEIPEVLRPRDHINQLLKLDEENELKEKAVEKVADVVLRDLKRLYDNAIKPLETLYKYRDLSNRHFGDPEIFSKPLVLFMGPWSGGKSSIINYLLDIEYKPTSLRTGAEPSPAYFNILMHGEEEEVLDGTQLAADWTFSGLQKFGQGLLDRLKGYKLKSKLLEKVNIVEIPGILEIRKQVQRLFPFNDACQWFIDRADIIFLVYDPSKLDVGPETEAILDQLKGREYQTRIILNKADQVKPEELMRVQGALIWNISPLMSSAEPPVMYSASLWSIPYEAGAPTRLLYAQERAFLRDLRSAVDKRVEHKIASARRFAVRVRNHAKMVDCYLTTYYNHKSFFAKKKDISDRIIENPQDYHIYEGLSTLTNISRYDLPDPDVYRDFFRLNALYEFPLLSSTCTYFRGCPINRLDVAIAYDLPELVGKYKKSVEAALHQEEETTAAPTPAPTPAAQQQAQKPTAKSGAGRISMS